MARNTIKLEYGRIYSFSSEAIDQSAEEFNGYPDQDNGIITVLDNFDFSVFNKMDNIKKAYRKSSEMPDPTKSHRADVNRTKKLVAIRLDRDLLRHIDDATSREDITRTELFESALKMRLGLGD